ncbi:DUF5131 family protein [Hoeflea sp. TYP-13]|uniref:DUF5131 family protein n=1 Tax=Hoeflea sp. TYP-13 TaxID=3230023 RepID=UPI0034C65EA2
MAENSNIEWTTHTFNPWIGCTKVSAACDDCYAEAWDKRFNGERWGPKAARTRTKPGNWRKPLKWNRECPIMGPRPRVFCASLADVFDNHKSIKKEWRDDLWRLIRGTVNLDWLLLTKRPQNIARFLPSDWGEDGYHNVWLGTTVENQVEANRRIPALLNVSARIHFLSCEPLLGPLDLPNIRVNWCSTPIDAFTGKDEKGVQRFGHSLDWVITGGENSLNFRPVDEDWFRALRDQCDQYHVPFLLKQKEGRNQREIKAKGRELDGVVHDEYPEPTQT